EAFRLSAKFGYIQNEDFQLFESLCEQQSSNNFRGQKVVITLDDLINNVDEEDFDREVFYAWTEDFYDVEEEEEEVYEEKIEQDYNNLTKIPKEIQEKINKNCEEISHKFRRHKEATEHKKTMINYLNAEIFVALRNQKNLLIVEQIHDGVIFTAIDVYSV